MRAFSGENIDLKVRLGNFVHDDNTVIFEGYIGNVVICNRFDNFKIKKCFDANFGFTGMIGAKLLRAQVFLQIGLVRVSNYLNPKKART